MVTFADNRKRFRLSRRLWRTSRQTGLHGTQGTHSLLDAIYLGMSKNAAGAYAKKAMLIISDGGDNQQPLHGRRNPVDGEGRQTPYLCDWITIISFQRTKNGLWTPASVVRLSS